MIFATRRSLTLSDHCFPLLPVNRNRTSDPSTATWRFLSVVSPSLVLLGVVVVPEAVESRLQQMHDGRQDLFLRKAPPSNMLAYFGPDRRQRVSERDDMFVFGALAHLTELRPVAFLQPGNTFVQAGGMARDRIRLTTCGSESFVPSGGA
jgi:hypothetical protein